MSGSQGPEPGEVAELFDRLEPLDAAARASVIDAECNGRPELRREVEELLAALPEGQALFGKPPKGVSHMFDSLQGYLLEGRQLGPFLIEGPLQEGGMSLVVRARDTRTGEAVALKLLAPELAGEPQWQRRFAREAAALTTLNHPGVVKLLETGQDQGFSYFTMELIEGENLRQRMLREWPSPAESVTWVRGILDALGAAHDAGFLHGDLKPENIMVDGVGRVRLLDFGLTRPLAPGVPVTQTASAVTGTIQYLSPERISGSALDARSDLFSVGVLLYEFLGRTTPFARPNPLATAAAILHEPAGELPAAVPARLAALVRSCLQKDAALRPASAAELARALDQAVVSTGRLRPGLVVAAALVVLALGFGAWRIFHDGGPVRTVRLTVPGTTDIWLAGQPNGAKVTGVFGADSVPANAPVALAVVPGHVLTFYASGSVSVDGDCYGKSADGGCYPDASRFGGGPANGLSLFQGPASALIGVFLNTRAPVGAPAPEGIDFRHVQSFPAMSPVLNQVFFIGDGLSGTGTGQPQRFTVPAGATHLFLAASDSLGSATGNLGTFTVDVRDVGAGR